MLYTRAESDGVASDAMPYCNIIDRMEEPMGIIYFCATLGTTKGQSHYWDGGDGCRIGPRDEYEGHTTFMMCGAHMPKQDKAGEWPREERVKDIEKYENITSQATADVLEALHSIYRRCFTEGCKSPTYMFARQEPYGKGGEDTAKAEWHPVCMACAARLGTLWYFG